MSDVAEFHERSWAGTIVRTKTFVKPNKFSNIPLTNLNMNKGALSNISYELHEKGRINHRHAIFVKRVCASASTEAVITKPKIITSRDFEMNQMFGDK